MALQWQAWGIFKHMSVLDFIIAKLSEFDHYLLTSSRYRRLHWPQYFDYKDSHSSWFSISSFLVELNVLLVVCFYAGWFESLCQFWLHLLVIFSSTFASLFLLSLNSLPSLLSLFLLLFHGQVSLWRIVPSGDSNKNSSIMGN